MKNVNPSDGIQLDTHEIINFSVKFKHYSSDSYFHGTIIDAESTGHVILKPLDPLVLCSYFEDDPVAIVLEKAGEIHSGQSYISSIDLKEGMLHLTLNKLDNFQNRRKLKRYPTSIFATLLEPFEFETGFINNINEGGLSILTNAQLKKEDVIELNTTLKDIPLHFKEKVIWKNEMATINEYGLSHVLCSPLLNHILHMIDEEITDSMKNT